ncbi:MAG: polyketide cyclase / dehydrase and lipid transport family protein [Pseudonocardiales bacterium]|nr:polyketide cyclase / dehydrase and lipid transport family protein [Pseudonocardiales bacterium]
MLNVSETADLNASPDEAWRLIGDFAGLLEAMGVPVTSDGKSVGAIRKVGANGEMIEQLTALDDDARSLTYVLLEPGLLPVQNYVSTMQVSEAADGRSTFTWSADFEAAGVDDETALGVMTKTYRGGIAGIRKQFGG